MTRRLLASALGRAFPGIGAAAVGAALFAAAAPASGQAGGEIRSTRSGVYTEEQAAAGLATYEGICSKCHDRDNPLRGPTFLDAWQGKPLYALWDFVTTRMPYDDPGSLQPEQYAAVLAYLLKLNGYPAGTTPLPHVPFEVADIDLDPPLPPKGRGGPERRSGADPATRAR